MEVLWIFIGIFVFLVIIGMRAERKNNVGLKWKTSSSGNPIIRRGKIRLTVFRHDKGWKFCVAQGDNDDDPYFSGAYRTVDEAKSEGIAFLKGDASKVSPVSRANYETVEQSLDRFLRVAGEQSAHLIKQAQDTITSPTVNVTKLRPIEKKIETKIRQLSRVADEYNMAGDSERASSATDLASNLRLALSDIQEKIIQLKQPKQKQN